MNMMAERAGFRRGSVYDLADSQERHDLILFMGVFYHLRYPLLALDILAEKTTRLMVFQTLTMPGDEVCREVGDRGIHEREAMRQPGWPKMAFIENQLAGDPTNWWAPNHACVEAMLRSAGMAPKRIAHETYLCTINARLHSAGR